MARGGDSANAARWRSTLQATRAKEWVRREDSAQSAALSLTEEVAVSARTGDAFQRWVSLPEPRLHRARGYGQFADWRMRDVGLYGTSAAIETIAMTIRLGERGRRDVGQRLVEMALGAWSTIDHIFQDEVKVQDRKYWEQAQVTLRLWHVLRAAAAVQPLLQRKPAALFSDQSHAVIEEDLSASDCGWIADDVAGRLATARGLGGREDDDLPAWMWGFATTTPAAPRGTNDAVFLTGSALVAVCRAYNSGILSRDGAEALCPTEDREWLIETVLDEGRGLDARFRLFGLWALSQTRYEASNPICHFLGAESPPRLPRHLRLKQDARHEHAARMVARTISELAGDPTKLVETGFEYSMMLPLSGKTDGAGGESDAKYHKDFFAVPVVPLALSLASCYRPSLLFRDHCTEMIARIVSTAGSDSTRALPYQQAANENATMFASYTVEALNGVGAAAHHISTEHSAFSRLRKVLAATFLRDHPRATTTLAATLVILIPVTIYLYNESPTGFGIWIGAILSVVVNLVTPPAARWLWND